MLRLTLAQGFVSALLSVCLVHSLLSFLRTRSRRQALASSQGCKDAPVNPHAGPFGIYELQEMKKAFHARVFLERSCKQYERYGFTFTSGFMAQKIVHTIEPENIKAVLSTNFAHYGIGSRRQNAFRPLLGESIFQLDGHAWAHSRSVLQSGFGRVQIENLDACEMYIEGVLKEIEEKTASEGHVDLAPIFHRLAAKLAVSFTCGFSPDSPAQEGGVTADEFVQAMHDASRVCEERWQMGPLSFLLPQKQFKRDIAKLHSYMESHVDQVLSSLDVKHEKKRDDFLAALAEKTKDRTALRDEACMLILAGTDTTACLLTNMFFIIGRSPAVWQKLREEVLVLNGRSPTSNDLKQLKYHQACVKETLRLLPVLPQDSRVAMEDTILPTGGGPEGKSRILVPSGTMVSFSIMALHRRKDLWGEDAEEFLPERWEGLQPGWKYIPFLQGPRICLGHELAMNELTFVLTRMVQRFGKVERIDSEPWIEDVSLGTTSAHGVKVVAVVG